MVAPVIAKRRKRILRRIVGASSLLFISSCTPTSENNSTISIPRSTADNSASIPDASTDAEEAEDAANSAGAQYQRREWVITRGNGTLVLEARGDSACTPLPEKRPTDFTMILEQRKGDTAEWIYYGLSEKSPCHFPWSMPWMDPPPGACKTIDPAAFDKLYARLRSLAPQTIRTRQLEGFVSPHRGGWGIVWRWGTVECGVSDILDTEVDPRDRSRFDAVQDLVRDAYQDKK